MLHDTVCSACGMTQCDSFWCGHQRSLQQQAQQQQIQLAAASAVANNRRQQPYTLPDWDCPSIFVPGFYCGGCDRAACNHSRPKKRRLYVWIMATSISRSLGSCRRSGARHNRNNSSSCRPTTMPHETALVSTLFTQTSVSTLFRQMLPPHSLQNKPIVEAHT